jgi:hypothetical protein
MDKWCYERLSGDVTFNSSQHITDCFRYAIHCFQEDARDLFHTVSIDEVLLLCKYLPIERLEDRATLVSQRSEAELDYLLSFLPRKKHNNSLHHPDDNVQLRKAKEVVWRVDRVLPSLPLWNREWILSLLESHVTANDAAAALDQEITSKLEAITLVETKRWACGYSSPVHEDLLQFISAIRHEFCKHLAADAAVRTKIERISEVMLTMIIYDLVLICEQALKPRNHVAWWPVSTCLSYPQLDDNLDPSDALLCISSPIQDILTAPNLTRIQKLRSLKSLDELYQQLLGGTGDRNWQSLLQFIPTTTGKKQTIGDDYLDHHTTNTLTSVVEQKSIVESCELQNWPDLLKWRVLEAEDLERSASDEDKCLIELFLPCLRHKAAQSTPSSSATGCQWRPPRALSKQHTASIIGQHGFKHFGKVSFMDIVKEAACGSTSESMEELHACARRIYYEYQSSERLRDEYARVRDVGFIDRTNWNWC